MHSGPAYGEPAHGGPGYGGTPSRAQILASDADRDRAVGLLKQAFTEGRLTKDDYDERAGQALAARSYADLDQVLAGLPVPAVPAPVGPAPATRGMNGLAVASLTCGVGQLFLGPLPTIPAIVLGHVARRQIRRTGEQGSGLAVAGLVLGWAGLAMMLLLAVAVVFAVGASSLVGGHVNSRAHMAPAPTQTRVVGPPGGNG